MNHNSFSWKTKFKSIIIVDGELFQNEYDCTLYITPHTPNLKLQTETFERLNFFDRKNFLCVSCLKKYKLIKNFNGKFK